MIAQNFIRYLFFLQFIKEHKLQTSIIPIRLTQAKDTIKQSFSAKKQNIARRNINQIGRLSDYIKLKVVMQKRSVREAIHSKKPSETIRIIDSRYEIKNIYLGQGSFGQVFVGWDKVAFEVLAVKMISKVKLLEKINRSKSKERAKEFYIKSLRDQALFMEKLDHPNIVRFNGYSESNSQLYFFLEYCNEGTLESLIQREGKLAIQIAIPLMKEILSAVIYLHRNNICHRDLKPQNILLHNGSAKIGDFGFAVNMKEGNSITSTYSVGTEQYMAPEIISDRHFSMKSDVWSMGIIFYRMICGQNPWLFCRDEKEWLGKVKHLPTIPCSTAPLWLKAAIFKMLTFSEDFRPIAEQLQHFFEY